MKQPPPVGRGDELAGLNNQANSGRNTGWRAAGRKVAGGACFVRRAGMRPRAFRNHRAFSNFRPTAMRVGPNGGAARC